MNAGERGFSTQPSAFAETLCPGVLGGLGGRLFSRKGREEGIRTRMSTDVKVASRLPPRSCAILDASSASGRLITLPRIHRVRPISG
jgi:hypothetical protein